VCNKNNILHDLFESIFIRNLIFRHLTLGGGGGVENVV
jgi:hypothetical protein